MKIALPRAFSLCCLALLGVTPSYASANNKVDTLFIGGTVYGHPQANTVGSESVGQCFS